MRLRSTSKRKLKRTFEEHQESDDEKVSFPASSQDEPKNAASNSQNDTSDNHSYRSHIVEEEMKKILKDLRNDNSLSIDDYLDVSRIFIMNIINSKTMTRLRTSTDSEFNGERTFRHALSKLTKSKFFIT